MPASTIKLTPEISDGIARFIGAQEVKQSPNEMVNAILGDWLTQNGIMKSVDCPPEVEVKGECE